MNKILICEKNPFIRDILRQIIQRRFPDLAVESVLSRKECMTKTGDFIPDILILGVTIYNGNELDMLDTLRSKAPSINIIIFTEYNIDEYRKKAIMKGANHVISKDIWTGNEILALLNTILVTKDNLLRIQGENAAAEESSVVEEFLELPIERRRKDPKGKAIEREYLAFHPDRRRQLAK